MLLDWLIFAAWFVASVLGIEAVRSGIANTPSGARALMKVLLPAPLGALLLVTVHAFPDLDTSGLPWWTVGVLAMCAAYGAAVGPMDELRERRVYPALDSVAELVGRAGTTRRRSAKYAASAKGARGYHPRFVFKD